MFGVLNSNVRPNKEIWTHDLFVFIECFEHIIKHLYLNRQC